MTLTAAQRTLVRDGRLDIAKRAIAALEGRGPEPERQAPLSPISPVAVELDSIPKPQLAAAALYGPVGEWVQLIAPHTEASSAPLLVSALVGIGALIGRNPHVILDGARHGVNLNAFLVGSTSTGRKGTAENRGRRLLHELDPEFAANNVRSGLSSGQGLIYHVRDAKRIRDGDGEKIVDAGVEDKRLLVVESEFAGPLRQARGRENTLSDVIRRAWDGGSLRTLTRSDPLTATDPHIAIIGQITPEELRELTDRTDFSNGLLNRFLFVHCERARCLPFGSAPDVDQERAVIDRVRSAVYTARRCGMLDRFTPAAREWWDDAYQRLTDGRAGRIGAATQRAAAQVRRIALLFAALDGAQGLDLPHFIAAGAVWNYAASSARYVFGTVDLTPRARKVAAGLLEGGAGGLDRTIIRDRVLGSHNIPARELDVVEAELTDAGLLDVRTIPTAGRSRVVWIHRQYGRNGQHGQEGNEPTDFSPISPNLPSGIDECAIAERAALREGV